MKTKIYTLLTILAILLPVTNLRAEEITGISDAFVFGAPPVPLSPLALVSAVFLIGIFLFWRYYKTKKHAV